jgi:exosortase A
VTIATHAESRPAAAWRTSLMVLLALCAAVLVIHRETFLGMVEVWNRSDTFAHGWLVPFVCLWLVWRQRQALAAAVDGARPAASALLGVALAGLAWMVGEAAAVNALRQFAAVAMLVLAVPVVLGWRVASKVAFPLGFLFFAVPFGDFLMPKLMEWTAITTVAALRMSGIPVFHEGQQIVIPSGTWSVVEACSGVRYLIASVVVGSLFAYLSYRSMRRRLVFIGVALAVPVLANWIRAYLIVMLGHLSGNTLAVGVDHLIYGWLFFGLVVGLMLMIGARWTEPTGPTDEAVSRGDAGGDPAPAPWWQYVGAAAAMLALLFAPQRYLVHTDDLARSSAPTLEAIPGLAPVNSAAEAALWTWKPAFSRPAAALEATATTHGQPVTVRLGYYRSQSAQSKLVSSSNVIVRTNDPSWRVESASTRRIDLPGRAIPVNATRVVPTQALSNAPGILVWQFYWIDGAIVANPARAKLREAWQRLRGDGDDGAMIVMHTSDDRATPSAERALSAFMQQHLPAIEARLAATRYGH